MAFRVESLLVGQVREFAKGESSAIAKEPVADARAVGWLGIAGDAQADLSVHGGPDKAVHHYPRDHYPFWQNVLGPLPLLAAAGAFGENISATGLTESVACIGDRYRLGTALVEIAQGRQPCWKQAHRLGNARVVATMVKSGHSGWYYRVLEEGVVAAGDTLDLINRPHPEWSVARTTGLLIRGDDKGDRAAIRALSQLAVLADGWRVRARQLADI